MGLVHAFDDPHLVAPRELSGLLGSKGANLAEMTGLGLPVPPGFIITTEACRHYLAAGWPPGLDEEVVAALARVEAATGRRFGDPTAPLLVSVRSGAPVSMPGMLDTVLDVGLDEAVAEGLARIAGDAGFAADCSARLRARYRAVVGSALPTAPRQQLRGAIEAVFRSWRGERAAAYRRAEGIDDDLGTAVVVQAMVFGNLGPDGAAGVCFSRDPATGEPRLYGDVVFGGQGEDVVDGTHATAPLDELDRRLPAAGAELRRVAGLLERHFADLVDLEFTVERGRLWLLQARVGARTPVAALRIAHDMACEPDFPLGRDEAVARVRHLLDEPLLVARAGAGSAGSRAPIARGLGASPGLATGAVVVSAAAAVERGGDGVDTVLVRPETSPADVAGMAEAAGLLTARGGLASHAAVVARGWGKPAVVGTEGLVVGEDHILLGGRRIEVGEVITIDGSTGDVHLGRVEGAGADVPEVLDTLRAWAAGP